MKKTLSVAFAVAVAVVACTTDGPTTNTPPTTTTPVAEATPPSTPTTVTPTPAPTTGKEHDAYVGKNGAYSVTNTTGTRAFYCAAAFGVLPGGEQGAGTYLAGSENQGERNNKDVFDGQFPKTAACQYKQIQGDLTQSKDCRKFDWHNVLAAAVWDNPSFIDGSKKTKLEALHYGTWTEFGPWSKQGCGERSRTRKVYEQYKYDCSGEIVRVEIRTETDTEKKECCTPYARLKLRSDPSLPGNGTSLFHYWIYKQVGSADIVPGFGNDTLVFSEKLPKNTVRYVVKPADGSTYYTFYDGEIGHRDYATAQCAAVQSAWDPQLSFECGCE